MITLSEAPSGNAILGGLNTSSNLAGQTLTVAPVGIRAVSSGNVVSANWVAGNQYGTLVGSLNVANGQWTCPSTGYYDLTTLFSVSADISPFNNLTSVANPNGFVGNGVPPNPDYPILATPQTLTFDDYFGRFSVGITDITGGVVYCSNTSIVTYDTSSVVISASYCGRRIVAGTILVLRYLNKCTNNMVGQNGNSFHLSITHLRNA